MRKHLRCLALYLVLVFPLIDLQCNIELKNIYPTVPIVEFYSKIITAIKFSSDPKKRLKPLNPHKLWRFKKNLNITKTKIKGHSLT